MSTVDVQEEGRLLAFGDIHGCLDPLEKLVHRVDPTNSDQIIFLGDYIDRGPDSAGVIKFLIEFGKKFPKTVFLRGNHEWMFLDYLDGKETGLFLMNGGTQTLMSYESRDWLPVPTEHVEFIHNLPAHYSHEDFLFVHAGLRPGIKLEDQKEHDLLWIRQEFIESDYDWGKTVVFGHTPLEEPLFSNTRIGLDTGCVYGKRLTCCEVRERKIWQESN